MGHGSCIMVNMGQFLYGSMGRGSLPDSACDGDPLPALNWTDGSDADDS